MSRKARLPVAVLVVILALGCFLGTGASVSPADAFVISPIITQTLAAPSDLAAGSYAPYQVSLSWKDNSSNEKGFIIERRTGTTGSYLKVDVAAANATSYVDTGPVWPIHPGETYYYRVKAYNDDIESAYSNETSATAYGYDPVPPVNLTATISSPHHYVDIVWEKRSSYMTEYELQRAASGTSVLGPYQTSFSAISALSATQTKYSDPIVGLQRQVEYRYRIKASNRYGTVYSETVSITIPNDPVKPSNFKALALSGSSMKITWKDECTNEDGYIISRKTEGGAYTPYTAGGDHKTGPNITEWIDTGNPDTGFKLMPETKYYYIICSYNAMGVSQAVETSGVTGPKAPTLFTAIPSTNAVKLTWTSNSLIPNLVFEVERKTDTTNYVKIATVSYLSEYTDMTVSPGTKYYYRVRAWAAFYPGDFSNEVSAVPGSGITFVPPDPGKTVISLNLGKLTYTVNSAERTLDAPPIIREGRTMLPIRYVAEPLNASVNWDAAEKKVAVALGETTIELWIGRNKALVNGVERMIDTGNANVMPIIVPPGRTMLPVRFITENLGCQVEWNAATQEVVVIK
jgi:titin